MFRLYVGALLITLSTIALSNPRSDIKVLLEQERAGGATNPVLMHNISEAYSLLGGSANVKLSYEYKVKAAELGHPEASYELYKAVQSGLRFKGVDKKRNSPSYWLGIASQAGNNTAQLIMAKTQLKSENTRAKKEAFETILNMVDQGNPEAILALAEIYIEGIHAKTDVSKAIELIDSFNEYDDSSGEGYYLLSRAKSASGDEKGRLQALNKAAQLGNSKASFELGVMLSRGDLNSRAEAEKHLKAALTKGYKQAEIYLNEIHNMNNSPILYNINLYRADRVLVRKRLETAGIQLVRSKGYLDYFEGDNLNGAYQLIAAYHVNDSNFTLAQLSFRFVGDSKKFEEINQKLDDKYPKKIVQGNATRRLRQDLLSSINSHSWKQGSVFIRLEKDVGKLDEMSLEYIIEPFASQMSKLLDKAKRKGAESGQLLSVETI